jgi:hypothetical protein
VTAKTSAIIETSVHPALVDTGYERLHKGVYKALWSTVEVEHFIYLFEDPKRKDIFTGDFGIRNLVAERFSCDAIRAYGGEIFKLFKCAELTDCTMRFSFARLDPSGWPIHLTGHSGEEVGERFHNFITEYLVPTFGRVTTLDKLHSLLTADTMCCPWIAANGAIRAAQIVALAGQIGLDAAHNRGVLESRKMLIARGGSKLSEIRANPSAYIDKLLEDWAAGRRGVQVDYGPLAPLAND